METKCIAIRSNGIQCEKNCKRVGDGLRCGTHYNTFQTLGPHTLARRELGYIHKKEIDVIKKQQDEMIYLEVQERSDELRLRYIRDYYGARIRLVRSRHKHIMADLVVRQIEEIRITGVDPDRPARERQRALETQRLGRIRRVQQHINEELDIAVPEVRQLGQFASDPQNVHTTEAVKQTKEIISLVRTIYVPEDYRWNTLVVSKTFGEIISECNVSLHAAAQMFNHYVSNTAIYDIEEGIYGKVLDSVWQYIKTSSDKEDLCRIMKKELEDNIGMCAQGNLSRICNILAGYMEGVGTQECLSERLGRLLSPIMLIESIVERVEKACMILKENNVPKDEWEIWVNPMIEDDSIETMRETLTIQ